MTLFSLTRRSSHLVLALLTLVLSSTKVWATDPLVVALNDPNHFAIMRHALAPGTGDPSNFDIDDCSTQRNLSEEGRAQATDIGDYLRENGVNKLAVYSSVWCRCVDTASLLKFGDVTPLPFLNSFYENRENEPKQTEQTRLWLSENRGTSPMILVTHQVNITALTGVYPASGEIIIVKYNGPGDLQIAGRIKR